MHSVITNLKILSIFFVFQFSMLSASIDFEDSIQDFVIETKQIKIPGFPNAFNPSIIKWNGSLLMCFRDIPNPLFSFTSFLYLVYLDDDFNPISTPQKLETQSFLSVIPSRAEDGRLIAVDDRLWLVFSDNKDTVISKGGFRVYFAELLENEMGLFDVCDLECIYNFQGEDPFRREKNWSPFVYNDEMYLIYSLDPHLIFKPIYGTQSCETVCCTNKKLIWDWGILRGGTPALILDGQYLTFFHSQIYMTSVHSDNKNMSHYFMGAYTFSLEPPFEITKFSPEPIVGKNFYHGPKYKPYWGSVRVVFPCGFVFDEKHIWVIYGRQDHESWVVKLDRQGLLDSLVPVTNILD